MSDRAASPPKSRVRPEPPLQLERLNLFTCQSPHLFVDLPPEDADCDRAWFAALGRLGKRLPFW